jgi:hypothetical protein
METPKLWKPKSLTVDGDNLDAVSVATEATTRKGPFHLRWVQTRYHPIEHPVHGVLLTVSEPHFGLGRFGICFGPSRY